MSIPDESRKEANRFLEDSRTLWENWNLASLTQQDWTDLYVEQSVWHKALTDTDKWLSVFLDSPEEEHETILHLLRTQQELLLCLQEVFFTDRIWESELQICRRLDESYALAEQQTAWDQKLARKKNMLRMAVLEHQLGEDRKARRTMRAAREYSAAGSEIRNVREFSACFEQEAEFESHLPVEGFRYAHSELKMLDAALEAFEAPLLSLMADYVLYNEQERAMLEDLFSQLVNMTSLSFQLHTREGEKEEAIRILGQFSRTADRVPAQIILKAKGNVWYMESAYAWLLAQAGRIEEADAFLKGHLCRPEKVRDELSDYASDAALLAQITDFLYFCYYVIYMKKYPLAVNEWKEFREHLSTDSFLAAREVLDSLQADD